MVPADHAAGRLVQLVSSRYELASLIFTGNQPPGRWGEIVGAEVVAAMIDMLVQHSEAIALKATATA